MKKTEERQRRSGQNNTNPGIQNSRKNRKKPELTEKTELKKTGGRLKQDIKIRAVSTNERLEI
jgi:hypothetical protein